MTRHSSIVGGSTAGRLLECPGSYQAQLALPEAIDVSSEYANEGTAMHAVMDNLMRLRRAADGDVSLHVAAGDLVGEVFHDREITLEHLDTMIYPALEALEQLEAAYGGKFNVLAVEQRVQFPDVPGAFGTVDLILGNATHVMVVDWKFGQGIDVPIIYDAGDSLGEKLNPQMMFYTAAAMNSLKRLFTNRRGKIVVSIIQPRADTVLKETVVTRREVKYFVEDMIDAVQTALDRNPPRQRGDHCRFAPCKLDCPLWTGPMLDLAAMGVMPRTEVVTKEPSPYGDYLAKAKALVDMLAEFKAEVDAQLHAYLEDGGTVPGWRLKAKTKMRQWIDEDTVWKELSHLGLADEEIWTPKLRTFAQVEAAAKKHRVKIPDHLRVAPPTNETTVCRTDDPAPPIERATAIEQFRASIPMLRKG